MRKTFFVYWVIFLLATVTLWQCGGSPEGKRKAPGADSLKSEMRRDRMKKEEQEKVPVEVATVKKGDISNFILLSSNLETEIMADVYSRIQGIVEAIHKEEGDYVNKGDLLLTLEAKEYELAEKKAKVELQRQQSNYNRLKAMHDKNLLSDEEFETARFALETAEIQWKEAQLNLDYTLIKSPISGRIGERLAKIGRRIQPTDKLFSVVNYNEMIAVVYVPEKNLGQLKLGQKAIVYSDHIPGETFKAWIKRLSPVVDPSSGTFKVTVGVRNKNNKLRPGMFVNVQIIVDTHKDVVLIPKTAIVYENEYMNVYIVRDGIAHKIRLTPGFADNEKVESLKDIVPGDKVIVIGQAGMKDKTPVTVVVERQEEQ